MDILTDISTLDKDMCFLDITESDVLVKSVQILARPNCKHFIDEGIDNSLLYDVGESLPEPQIENQDASGVSYSLVQSLITEESGFEASDIPTEPTLKEYIAKLKLNSKYLVLRNG